MSSTNKSNVIDFSSRRPVVVSDDFDSVRRLACEEEEELLIGNLASMNSFLDQFEKVYLRSPEFNSLANELCEKLWSISGEVV